jgi:hypothetical protein
LAPSASAAQLLPRACALTRILLKTDTQGYDLEVFRGAHGILPHVAIVQMEIPLLHIYRDVPDFCAIIGEVRGQGFHVAGMFPVVLDEAGRLAEFDCLFVRQDMLPGGSISSAHHAAGVRTGPP